MHCHRNFRLVTVTYPIGGAETFTYYGDGNVQTRKTRAGQTIAFAYDNLQRLCTKAIAPFAVSCSATTSGAPTSWFRYDLMGHLSRAFTNSFTTFPAAIPPSGSTVQYVTNTTYDSLNRPTNVSWTPSPAVTAPSASSVTFAHGYNKSNQRISQSVTDNSWFNYPAATPSTTTYVANELNQYTAVGSVTPGYDANGNLSSDGTQTFAYSP